MASKSVGRALIVDRARAQIRYLDVRRDRPSLDCSSSAEEEVGPETPMETKSRLKVTVGRDPGLPPSVERASPPHPYSPNPIPSLGKQISTA